MHLNPPQSRLLAYLIWQIAKIERCPQKSVRSPNDEPRRMKTGCFMVILSDIANRG